LFLIYGDSIIVLEGMLHVGIATNHGVAGSFVLESCSSVINERSECE
jgi:hypothetical protein